MPPSSSHRTRSRSPYRSPHVPDSSTTHQRESNRTRSPPPPAPHRQTATATATATSAPRLPFHAKPISKHDFAALEPLFALYLDVQKQLDVADLSRREVRGRWKSFVGKWNQGSLAEGWYEPATKRKALASWVRGEEDSSAPAPPPHYRPTRRPRPRLQNEQAHDADRDTDTDTDTDIGPSLPPPTPLANSPAAPPSHPHARPGPTIPPPSDASHGNEHAPSSRVQPQHGHKLEPLSSQTRVRKGAVQAGMHDAKGGEEVDDGAQLFGNGGAEEGECYDYSERARKVAGRKKSERAVRREEMERARAAERAERGKEVRAKEERTMGFLRALAEARFGVGDGAGAVGRRG